MKNKIALTGRTRTSGSRRSSTNPLGIGSILLLALVFVTPSILQAVSPPGEAQSLPEVKTYDELRRAISETRAASRVRVEKAVEQERVREAWEIGKLIDAHVLQHKERADYGGKVLERLSVDLGISHTELKYMLQFARAYPISRPADQLSWSHYEALLAVSDPVEREALAVRAEKEKWTRDRTREEVRTATQKETPRETKDEEPLKPAPLGTPGTYKIILEKEGPYEGELALDLGFSIHYRLSKLTSDLTGFKEGELVSFEGDEMQLLGKPRSGNIEDRLYTYNGRVTRVLDGDTIEAVIDLGFGVTTAQVLRLRGVDCPELVTKDGKEAKAFTGSVLENGIKGSLLIKTSKSDKYDRYLADIHIANKNGDVQYLNGLLIEKGLAVRVRE
jgi:micrococcal nuclease